MNVTSVQSSEKEPKPLPTAGPKTNDPFEELRQNPRSEYSLSMVYSVAMMAIGEKPTRGDSMFYNEDEKTWTLYRTPPFGIKETKTLIQLVQVTHGGSIQFRVLEIDSGLGWKSAYLPTAALMRTGGKKKGK